jgi:hypothetical protein
MRSLFSVEHFAAFQRIGLKLTASVIDLASPTRFVGILHFSQARFFVLLVRGWCCGAA